MVSSGPCPARLPPNPAPSQQQPVGQPGWDQGQACGLPGPAPAFLLSRAPHPVTIGLSSGHMAPCSLPPAPEGGVRPGAGAGTLPRGHRAQPGAWEVSRAPGPSCLGEAWLTRPLAPRFSSAQQWERVEGPWAPGPHTTPAPGSWRGRGSLQGQPECCFLEGDRDREGLP